MSPSEKIAALETLLARVTERRDTRPARTALVHAEMSTASATESAAPAHAIAQVPVISQAEIQAPTPTPPASPSTLSSSPPAVTVLESPRSASSTPPRTSSSASIAAIRAGASTPASSGAYVARGGVADELPELELGEEEDEDVEMLLVDDDSSPDLSSETSQEEFAIPLNASRMLGNATTAAEPLSVETSTHDAFEIDRRPLASAVPPASATAQLERLPPTDSTPELSSSLDELADGLVEVSASSITPPAESTEAIAVDAHEDTQAIAAPPSDQSLITQTVESSATDTPSSFEVESVESAPTLMATVTSVVPPSSDRPSSRVTEAPAADASNESSSAIEQEPLQAVVFRSESLEDVAIVEHSTVIAQEQAPTTFLAMLQRSVRATLR